MHNPPLNSVTVQNVTEAVEVISTARSKGISASYHPAGGHGPAGYIPLSHTVYMLCEIKKAIEIKQEALHAPTQ